MCYMESIGVRELRQDASGVLERVRVNGVTIEVTNHGRPVAHLVPVPRRLPSSRAELVESGVLRPGRGDLLDVEPVLAPPATPSTGELLDDGRADR